MSKLALLGGSAARKNKFPSYNTIGIEEKQAVMKVMDSSVLSQYLGEWHPDFYGGPRVLDIEEEWKNHFGVKHAISVNSATSGLYAAVGAAGVGPGDEVIVSPFTMTASATAALVYGAIPVFADIDENTYCLSPDSVSKNITPYTKAIIVVDLFGHPAEMNKIMAIAKDHNLLVIEDTSQSPGAKYHGKYAGTLADIGVFSLNYHKIIHSGEGGIIVTNKDDLAERLQLIRNHGEAVVKPKGVKNLVNMIGFNYRMTELEAAIASEQLKKFNKLLSPRIEAGKYLTEKLSGLPGIILPNPGPEIEHVYYCYAMRFIAENAGVSREIFVEALRAEGIPVAKGFVEPLYMEPVYQQRIAFGKDGFPFTYPGYKGKVCYDRGICPVTERMHYEEWFGMGLCHANMQQGDLDDVVNAFTKVFENIDDLKTYSSG